MLLVTIQSELSQSDQNLNELYSIMVESAYEDLIKRAEQLKSYSFFAVDNGELIQHSGSIYYTNPIPINWKIPLRRKTYIKEEGGVFRCGVLLILTVQFKKIK